MAEEILAKRVPLKYVILLIIYALPSIIALAFPFATLVGALMTFGRFSTDNEIIALKTTGISQHRIFLPLLIIGIIFSFISFIMNDYFLPLGTVNFTKLYKKLIMMNPEMELESYSIKRYQDSTIVIGEVKDKEIYSILIIRKENDSKRIIQAERAHITDLYKSEGIISLELINVFAHTYNYRDRDSYDYLHADSMIYNILLKDLAFSIQNPGPREMRSVDVKKVIKEKDSVFQLKKEAQQESVRMTDFKISSLYRGILDNAVDFDESLTVLENTYKNYMLIRKKKIEDRSLKIWKLEYFQKFSIPFSCFPFIFIAFPLGLMTRKSGKAVGFGIGLILTVIYWCLLVVGRTLGIRSGYNPFLTMWTPNIVIFIVGSVLYVLRVKK